MDSPKKKLNILLIDDEELVLELASEILTFLGHHVVARNSGRAGIDYFKEHQQEIDLIIVDLLMPDMNGKECYEEIRQIDARVPVIISTGISDVAEKESLKQLQVFAFLEKPYTVPQIEKIVNQVSKAASN